MRDRVLNCGGPVFPKKFWVAQNGKFGTAHIGRGKSMKDFRPARVEMPSSISGVFRLHPADGWTESVTLRPSVTQRGRELSENGGLETIFFELRAEFEGVVFHHSLSEKRRTELGRKRAAERDRRLAEAEQARKLVLKEREPGDRAELEAWLDARLADPLLGGRLSAGVLVRKPSRARWAVGRLVDAWLREFPLQEGNQFATRVGVFRILQIRSGSQDWGAGGRLVQHAVLDVVEKHRRVQRVLWEASRK